MSRSGDGIKEKSGLAYIEVSTSNPFDLFKEWHSKARNSDIVLPNSLTFATATREGKVTARTLMLRRVESDGFVVITDRRSRKSRDLAEVPAAAMVFLWNYVEDGKKILSQVRVEGPVKELEAQQHQKLYNSEPLFCKLRSNLCHQGASVDWNEHKTQHDELLKEWQQGVNPLAMPDHFVAYKLEAEVMEFYYAWDNMIADRVLFLRDPSTKVWTHQKIAA